MYKWMNRITTLLIIILLAASCVLGVKYVNQIKGMLSSKGNVTPVAEQD